MSSQIGVIHEIGDLGLGFEPISESEQEKINNANSNDKED